MGFAPAPPLAASERARVRAELGVEDDAPLVLAVARLVPVKGIDVLVEAAARRASRAAFVVAGDGPARAQLERLARDRGAPVRFLGAVNAERRDALLGAADVFVAPSRPLRDGRTEGAPVAVLEAMGAGLAVVASDAGGLRELVGDAAESVPAGDPTALARAIDALARDPARRAALGARARDRAAPLRWPAVAAEVERVLEEAQGRTT